jgi:hypothetical protein
MEDAVLVNAVPQLHIRFEGRSIDVNLNELDIGDRSTDAQIRNAVADHLGVPVAKLQAFAIDRAASGEMTLRPEAVFG